MTNLEEQHVSMREKQGLGWIPMTIISVGLSAGVALWGWTMVTVVEGGKQTASIIAELRSVSADVADIKRATSDLVTKSEFEALQERQLRLDERQTGRIDQLQMGLEATRRDFIERRN